MRSPRALSRIACHHDICHFIRHSDMLPPQTCFITHTAGHASPAGVRLAAQEGIYGRTYCTCMVDSPTTRVPMGFARSLHGFMKGVQKYGQHSTLDLSKPGPAQGKCQQRWAMHQCTSALSDHGPGWLAKSNNEQPCAQVHEHWSAEPGNVPVQAKI